MLNFIKESFTLTNKYIILITPLLLFSLISGIYMIATTTGGSVLGYLCASILLLLMLSAFVSGWGVMIRNAIKDTEPEEPFLLIKDFVPGVGEYFMPVLGSMFCAMLVAAILMLIAYIIGMKYIGDPGVSMEALNNGLASLDALKDFLESLSKEQLFKLNVWNLLLIAGMTIFYFIVIFFLPSLFFKTKNPFKASLYALKNLFGRKIFMNLLLYILLIIGYTVFSVTIALMAPNSLIYFIFSMLSFYLTIWATMFVFDYYYHNFIEVGGNLDKRV